MTIREVPGAYLKASFPAEQELFKRRLIPPKRTW